VIGGVAANCCDRRTASAATSSALSIPPVHCSGVLARRSIVSRMPRSSSASSALIQTGTAVKKNSSRMGTPVSKVMITVRAVTVPAPMRRRRRVSRRGCGRRSCRVVTVD
jgi:hypothetical protein